MGKSLSLDIRERVVSLVETGHSCHEASRRLCISAASAVRIMQRRRRTGCVAPALQGRPRQTQTEQAGCGLGLSQRAERRCSRHNYVGVGNRVI